MPAKKTRVPSVWARADEHKRPGLSRATIVAEAVRLLDADGIDGLSMRRLGALLGAGATSLYRHVASKDELIELAVDAVYGELSVPKATDWRTGAIDIARSTRAMILKHPWIAAAAPEAGLSYRGPNVMRIHEDLLTIFVVAGCTVTEADRAVTTIAAYAVGLAIGEAATLTKVASLGLDVREWMDGLQEATEEAARPYPHSYQLCLAYRGKDPKELAETQFTQQLELILDGIAQLINRRAVRG